MKRLALIGLVVCTLASFASEAKSVLDSARKDSSVVESFSIYYECDSTELNPDYLGNKAQISRILSYIHNSPRIDSITIYSWSSPEGRYSYNMKLSRERGKSAKRFLLSHSPDSAKLDSGKIRLSPIAENWSGFISAVTENYHRHDREAVLEIINDETIRNDVKKWKLHCLD